MDLSEVSENKNRHPWEISRADFILEVLHDEVSLGEHSRILDIGAGDLYFAIKAHLANSAPVDAVDNAFDDDDSKVLGIQKIKHLDQILNRRYDLICAMDVLEHVEQDEKLLNELLGMLKPGGVLLITVPAFQILYSLHDLNLRHLRRYHRGHLEYLIQDPNSVEVIESFYFFHLLLYFRIMEKLGQFFLGLKPSKGEIHSINRWAHPEHHPLTRSLGVILSIDARLCRFLAKFGIRLPGLSLCMVIRKNHT